MIGFEDRRSADRTYTLSEVTAAAGVALKRAEQEKNVDRALWVFTDVLIQELKK